MTVSPTTRLLVIRHGETVWNREERFQGHGDSPLTETGRSQAKALARRIGKMAFDALVSSDLGRARETAALIAEATGHVIQTDSRLRERNYGVLEGLTVPEIERRHGGILRRFHADDPDYVIPSGESHRQHYRRNIAFIEEWVAKRAGTTAVLVVHGGVMDSVFRFVAGLPLAKPRCYVTANTGLTIVNHGVFYGTLRWVIESWCDVGHLDGIGRHAGLG